MSITPSPQVKNISNISRGEESTRIEASNRKGYDKYDLSRADAADFDLSFDTVKFSGVLRQEQVDDHRNENLKAYLDLENLLGNALRLSPFTVGSP